MNTTPIEFMAYSEDNNKLYTYAEIDAMETDGCMTETCLKAIK